MPLTNLRDVQIPGYGTLAGEPPPVDKHGFMKRGFVPGLLQEVGVQYGAYFALVFYMWVAPLFGGLKIDKNFPCQRGESAYIKTYFGSAVCEYTKTYVWSFPHVAAASLVLLIGRDLVQKRFYYFMLKQGGVMSFITCPMFKDSIVLANMWAFGHFWIFVTLVLFRLWVQDADASVAWKETAKAASARATNPFGGTTYENNHLANSGDPHGLQLLIQLLVMLGIPGVLFMGRLLSAYHIEQGLVPLSEYIRDTTTGVDQEETQAELADEESDVDVVPTPIMQMPSEDLGTLQSVSLNAGAVGQLISIKDNCLCPLLQMHIDSIVQDYDSKNQRYKEVLQIYFRQGWYKLRHEPEPIQLIDGLWPAPFVLAPPRPSPYRAGFRSVWAVYTKTSLFICSIIIFIQVVAMMIDFVRIFMDHPVAAFALVGEIFNIYFVGRIWHKIYTASAPKEKNEKEEQVTLP